MNIFILDKDICKSVAYHCDKHVVKMPLEAAQITSTALNIIVGRQLYGTYKKTHTKHPVVMWAVHNLDYVIFYGLKLCREYTYRYGKQHKCELVLERCFKYLLKLPDIDLDNLDKEIWPEVSFDNAPQYYQNIYREKWNLMDMRWSKRKRPMFMSDLR